MKRIVVILLAIIVFSSCNKDDENSAQISGVSLIDTDQGFDFTLVYPDGKEKKVKSGSIFGTFNGQLLDGDYYKSMRGGASGFKFDFRFSIPKDVNASDVIENSHQLRSQRLKLEQTGNLSELQTEFWLGTSDENDEFDAFTNVTGSAKYQQNVAAIGERIAIAVEINGSVINRKGENVKITGIFWKAKDDDIR